MRLYEEQGRQQRSWRRRRQQQLAQQNEGGSSKGGEGGAEGGEDEGDEREWGEEETYNLMHQIDRLHSGGGQIDWSSVATAVQGGRSAEGCLLQFLQLPLEDACVGRLVGAPAVVASLSTYNGSAGSTNGKQGVEVKLEVKQEPAQPQVKEEKQADTRPYVSSIVGSTGNRSEQVLDAVGLPIMEQVYGMVAGMDPRIASAAAEAAIKETLRIRQEDREREGGDDDDEEEEEEGAHSVDTLRSQALAGTAVAGMTIKAMVSSRASRV
jgi:hypothetical protein